MVSQASNILFAGAETLLHSAVTAPVSTNSADSFTQQLSSALESYLSQSGNGSQFSISVQPGQGSGSGQYVVTITAAPTTAPTVPASLIPGAPIPGAPIPGAPIPGAPIPGAPIPGAPIPGAPIPVRSSGSTAPSLSSMLQDFANTWSVLTPQQVAFQLANASGTGGGPPSAAVPGGTITFGDLTQSQQIAFQYAQDSGTGGLSMDDFLAQNVGPQTAWNISYNQAQAIPAIQAVVDPAYQVAADGTSAPIQAPNQYATPPAGSGNAYNLPNPALIPYLPPDQQAAAWAALAAEGPYGENAASAAGAYA